MKKIKKILSFIIILVLITNSSFVFSNNWCPIEETPEYIKEYVKNKDKVIKNIINSAQKIKSEENKEEEKSSFWSINRVYWKLNSLFSWTSYELDFDFYTQKQESEIADQIKRDRDFLEKEVKKDKKILERYSNLYGISVKKEDICTWIDENICNIIEKKEFEDFENLITKIIKSTKEIKWYISDSATDEDLMTKDIETNKTIVFLSKQNLKQIQKDYSKETAKICPLTENKKGEKWFFWKILESIKNLWSIFNLTEKSSNDWEEAIDLLWWKSNEKKYRQKEREVLARELSNQWIYWDSASAIMWNLEAFNSSWVILWWKHGILNSMKMQIDEFQKTIDIEFKENNKKSIPISYLSTKSENLKNNEEILVSIRALYNESKTYSKVDNKTEDKLINRIIDMHISLSQSINTLNKTCDISVKTCNSQKAWQWDCWNCN